MATRKIADLTQATTASDADLMVIQDTSKTKKITFATLLTGVKSKLGVGTAANLNTTSKEIVGAINEINTNLNSTLILRNTSSDFNALKQTGIYWVSNYKDFLNSPGITASGFLFVCADLSGNRIFQIAFTNLTPTRVYSRLYAAPSWQIWT